MSNTIYQSQKTHYVYLITELLTNMKYIGLRSCNTLPHLDLGIKYFSSSTNKEFIKNQKLNKKLKLSNYKYEILSIHNTRKEAINEEITLHELYDVDKNPEYYNKAKQTSTGWDAAGKVTVKDKDGNTSHVSINDPRYISGELVGVSKNTTLSDETRAKLKITSGGSNNGMYGKKHSPEAKQKMSEKASKRVGELHPQYNKVRSKEHCSNLSKSIQETFENGRVSIWKDKNLPDYVKEKISKTLIGKYTGINSPVSKQVMINGVKFGSLTEAAKFYNISISTVKNRCISITERWKDWILC